MGMRFNANVMLMGVEFGQQRDFNNPSQMKDYWKVGLMQGISSKVFNISQEDYCKFYDMAPGTNLSIVCDFNEVNGRTYLKLEDYELIGKSKDVTKSPS